MVPVRIVLMLSLLSVASLRLLAQRPPADIPTQSLPQWNSSQSVTTIHATARLVVLDVVVSDGHGHPTSGLSPTDFTVTEDGVPQALINFTEHDASTADQSALETQLPPNTFAVHPPVTGNGAMTECRVHRISFHPQSIEELSEEFHADYAHLDLPA